MGIKAWASHQALIRFKCFLHDWLFLNELSLGSGVTRSEAPGTAAADYWTRAHAGHTEIAGSYSLVDFELASLIPLFHLITHDE